MMPLRPDTGCAGKLKVLSDPTRLSVVEILMDGPKYVGAINERLGVEQTLLSHHLKILREAGLVEAVRDGKAVEYRLAEGIVASRSGKAINLGCCRLSFE
jgi:DNA-binding transcriptional ArsR family regulator